MSKSSYRSCAPIMGAICAAFFPLAAHSSVPAAPPGFCVDDSPNCGVVATTAAVGIKWHPGHYLVANNGATLAERLAYCDEIGSLPYIKGLQVRYFWADFETSRGNYDFSDLEQVLARCQSRGKRLMVEVWWRKFNTTSPSGIVPGYIQNEGGSNANMYDTGDGYAVAIWRQPVADRAIALYQAMAARFDREPYFEMVSTKETAAGSQATSVGDYSGNAYVNQLKRILSASRAAWPNTQFRLMANYITGGSSTNMIDIVQHAKVNGITVGGPDIFPTGTDTTAARVMRGDLGGVDYRGQFPIAFNVEVNSLTNWAVADIYDHAINTLEANYISWLRNSWNTSIMDWSGDIKPFLQKHPLTVTTCPAQMRCRTE